MPLTVQKLQLRIGDLGRIASGPQQPVSTITVAPAIEAMEPPLHSDEARGRRLDIGQIWGGEHCTSWLLAPLRLPEAQAEQSYVLHLRWETVPRDASSPWDTGPKDGLQLQLEATVFLDGTAIGGFDSRHHTLALPNEFCDNRQHTIAIRAYTRRAAPFGGLAIHTRNERLWQLYRLMQTLFDVYLSLGEHSLPAHRLLELLNNTYLRLDLSEGWRSKQLTESAYSALNYLQSSRQQDLSSIASPHIVVNGHAHLDVGWLWPFWRTRQKIEHTLANVLGLMDRYPHYYYSQSQPQLLQWLKEDAPEIYARVKERIREGRIEPVGAMWVEADCNLPSGESLVRQFLYGTRFLQQEFGITPHLIWLPDTFGFSAALPQIMRGCNIATFMTTKLSWNQFNRIPCDTFRWRGIDGSEVLAHFITAPDVNENAAYYTYNGPLQPEDIVKTWENYQQKSINDKLLYLCGWGDGGGGPTEDQLERVEIMANLPDFPKVKMGRITEYFTDLYERVWNHPRLPTWVGELYLEFHRGTYTSQAAIKRTNRQAELFYHEVELLNAWATLYGMPSRQDALRAGWQNILLNQFHDVLPGSSIPEVYIDAKSLYQDARSLGEGIRREALTVLTQSIGVRGDTLWLLNTLPWERTDPVQLSENRTGSIAGGQRSIGWDSTPIILLDGLRLPSYSITNTASSVQENFDLDSRMCHAARMEDQVVLHNDYYELVLNSQGEICRLYDKQIGRKVFASEQMGNQLIAYEDRPLNFDAWDIEIYYEEKPYVLREAVQMVIIEDGPIRATVEVTRHFLSSHVRQRISLWRNSPRIDFATDIDWHERDILLKAAFPLAVNSTRATYEIQFGSVERPTHRNTSWDWARFEVYAHRWADLSEGGYGVSLLNDGKYGYDIHDHIMRLTLLKSSTRPDSNADQGVHRFTYSLLPHKGDWQEAQTVRRAYELNVPIVVLGSTVSLPVSNESKESVSGQSFLSTDCEHVVVETVKLAEDGDGLIARLYEAHNQRGRGNLIFVADILSAEECNLLEEPTNPATYQGNRLAFQVKPFEIKAFRVRLASAIV
ncbi:MAG: alpha-mannosidase [Ktedonobacteraceae bacterium]